jgi:hypothetical protein
MNSGSYQHSQGNQRRKREVTERDEHRDGPPAWQQKGSAKCAYGYERAGRRHTEAPNCG